MNLLGHIRVATTQSDDPAVWLGAALPDLQREAGVVVGEHARWSDAVVDGLVSHRRADATFHDLDLFRVQSISLTRSLCDAGLPRGAARAVGHAGWEILLDGALVGDAMVVDAYGRAMSLDVGEVGRGLADDEASRWRQALAMRVQRGTPTLYADPLSVAELLWRVLRGRRLLAFDRSDVAAVSSCLAEAQPAIVAAVPAVFEALAE